MKKRLSLLMVLMMIVSLLPMSAFAASTPSTSGGTITDRTQQQDLSVTFEAKSAITPGLLAFDLDNAKLAVTSPVVAVVTARIVPTVGAATTITSQINAVQGQDYFTLNIPTNMSSGDKLDIVMTLDLRDSNDGDIKLAVEDIGAGGKTTGIGSYPQGLILATMGAYSDSLYMKVVDSEKTVSFDGGKLSAFEIRNFTKNGSTGSGKLEIKLDKDDYYAFTSNTEIYVDGAKLPANQYTFDQFVIAIDNGVLNGKSIVRVVPEMAKMGRSAATGSVVVDVENSTWIAPTTTPVAAGYFKLIDSTYGTIGKVVEFGITMTVVEKNKKEIQTVWGGEEAKVTVTLKGPKGSFSSRGIEFEVKDADVKRGSITNIKMVGATASNYEGSGVGAYKNDTVYKDGVFVIDAKSGQNNTLDQATEISFDAVLVTDYDVDGTATITASQRGWEQTADAVKIVPRFTMSTKATDIKKGGEAVETAPITLTEGKAGLLRNGDKITVVLQNDRNYLTFNSAKDIKVEATNGMVLGDVELLTANELIARSEGKDALVDSNDKYTRIYSGSQKIGFEIPVKKGSTGEAAVITINGMKVLVDGSTPDSVVKVYAGLNGHSIRNAEYVNVVKEYGLQSVQTTFTIGQTAYVVKTGNKEETKSAHSAPYIKAGRTMLPIRAVAESLGLTVQWNSATRTASFTDANKVAAVTIGAKVMYVNGTPMPLTVPAELVNDTTFVELRSLATAFGVQIDWDNAAKTAIVSK